jgi:uncharacterized RDD family membrane protein YckC
MDEPQGVTEERPQPYATFWPRVVARLIDVAILAVINSLVLFLLYDAVASGRAPTLALWHVPIMLAVFLLYFAAFTVTSGQTPGKRFLGLQVQHVSGAPVGTGQAIARAAVELAFGLVLVPGLLLLDCLWVALDKRSRAGHDWAAGTVVKHVRPQRRGVLLIAVILAALSPNLISFVDNHLRIEGIQSLDNMAPTIRRGEKWSANRLTYRFRAPAEGEVIAFRASFGNNATGRVVGLAGDNVAFRHGQVVHVAPRADGVLGVDEVRVAQGTVAVLGDNRVSANTVGFREYWGQYPVPLPAVRGQPPNPCSPILTVEIRSILGQVQTAGTYWPYLHYHLVR